MGLYTGGLIFGGAYIWNGVNVSNLMGLYTGGAYIRGGLYSEVYGILLRLASKFLNYTCCPREMVKKLNKYAVKHKINTTNINSDTFTSLPVAFWSKTVPRIPKSLQSFSTFC